MATTFISKQREAAGYPPSEWRTRLQTYEQDALVNIRAFDLPGDGNGFTKHLATSLNYFRKDQQNDLPEVLPGVDGCGGG